MRRQFNVTRSRSDISDVMTNGFSILKTGFKVANIKFSRGCCAMAQSLGRCTTTLARFAHDERTNLGVFSFRPTTINYHILKRKIQGRIWEDLTAISKQQRPPKFWLWWGFFFCREQATNAPSVGPLSLGGSLSSMLALSAFNYKGKGLFL